MIFTTMGLFQYFCIIDFLLELPLLIFIRILYFHNPITCGNRINIGQSLDGMANQAFVLLTREPFTVTRTFIINSISFGLSMLWFVTSIVLMKGGAMNKQSKPLRWPWIIVTTAVCGLDLVATVTYANDTFHTRTLTDMMDFIGGDVSGTGNLEVDTSWTAWVMVLIYSRFIILFLFNLILMVLVVIDGNKKRFIESIAVQVEAPTTATTMTGTDMMEGNFSSDRDEDELDASSETPVNNVLPRPKLRQSFRLMKARLFRKPSPVVQSTTLPYSIDESAERTDFPYLGTDNADSTIKNTAVKSVQAIQVNETDKKRTVNFPKNLLSLPQRLENMIAKQQRRLDQAVIDTADRHSPPRASQSLPQLASTSAADMPLGRRGTAAELQGQLPWAYIPASGQLQRDQLPPGEDLPPVPLPDYTAIGIPSFRKASVHRAASSISSFTQKLDFKSQLSSSPLNQLDVLY